MSIDAHQYMAHLTQVTALASCVEDIPVSDMLQHITWIHTVGPILDPTAYRNRMGNLDQQERLLRSLAPFVATVKALKAEEV